MKIQKVHSLFHSYIILFSFTLISSLQAATKQYVDKNDIKMNTGQYTGTGTYGEGNKNVLTFDDEPWLVIVSPLFQSSENKDIIFINPQTLVYSNDIKLASYPIYLTWTENSVSWYCNKSEVYQMNSNSNYVYVAFCKKKIT